MSDVNTVVKKRRRFDLYVWAIGLQLPEGCARIRHEALSFCSEESVESYWSFGMHRSLEHVEWCTVAPWLWRWKISHQFLLLNFGWVCVPMQVQILSSQQVNWIPTGIGLGLFAWDACFDREFGSSIGLFGRESGLELHSFFLQGFFPPYLKLYFHHY